MPSVSAIMVALTERGCQDTSLWRLRTYRRRAGLHARWRLARITALKTGRAPGQDASGVLCCLGVPSGARSDRPMTRAGPLRAGAAQRRQASVVDDDINRLTARRAASVQPAGHPARRGPLEGPDHHLPFRPGNYSTWFNSRRKRVANNGINRSRGVSPAEGCRPRPASLVIDSGRTTARAAGSIVSARASWTSVPLGPGLLAGTAWDAVLIRGCRIAHAASTSRVTWVSYQLSGGGRRGGGLTCMLPSDAFISTGIGAVLHVHDEGCKPRRGRLLSMVSSL